MAFGEAISNPASFHDEARYQCVCAVCGHGGAFHSHHVVPRQELRRRGLPQWDTRNALRLCAGSDGDNCHMQFEWAGPGKVLVEQRHLLDVHFCYLFEALASGPGTNLLERLYGGSDDERWQRHREHRCLDCQLYPTAQDL